MKKNNPSERGFQNHYLKFIALVVIMLTGTFLASAQNPACNISGPLKACTDQGNIVINVEVAYSSTSPDLAYSFGSNTSGASIVSVEPYVYSAASESGTQRITVNPGSNEGTFNLRLNVRTTDGQTSSCSKSVTVISCQSKMDKQ